MLKEKFLRMLDLQDKFNSKLNPNWKSKTSDDYDWGSCVLAEGAESLSSIQYKHWKLQPLDMANFGVEIIDIFHFIMSQHLVKHSPEYLAEIYETRTLFGEDNIDYDIPKIKSLKREVKDLVLATLLFDKLGYEDNMYSQLESFFNIMELLDWSVDDLEQKYLCKNVLNELRQNNGYKEGTYVKMWTGTDGKKYEDNVIAYEIYDYLREEGDVTYYSLLSELQLYYNDKAQEATL